VGLGSKTRGTPHENTVIKPARERASYTEEYKQRALALWRASGRSASKVAAELGIRPPLLYRWARTERPPANSPPGQKRLRSVEELEAEIRRLRAENTKLLKQREVLKKLWASSPKCRRAVCPDRSDERPTQGSLALRGAPGLAQWLLPLGEAAPATQPAATRKPPFARAHPG
jgi:transposase